MTEGCVTLKRPWCPWKRISPHDGKHVRRRSNFLRKARVVHGLRGCRSICGAYRGRVLGRILRLGCSGVMDAEYFAQSLTRHQVGGVLARDGAEKPFAGDAGLLDSQPIRLVKCCIAAWSRKLELISCRTFFSLDTKTDTCTTLVKLSGPLTVLCPSSMINILQRYIVDAGCLDGAGVLEVA